jgi:signal transduction histidine kinase
LLNVESKLSLQNEINNNADFEYKIYSFENQEFKIVHKISEYSQNQYNVLCFFDVNEIKKLEKEKVDKTLQTTLMATMCHELRTPLNGIIGNIKSIKESARNAYQTEISSIESCSTMLLMKVNDMLVNTLGRISLRLNYLA